jgi:hypothetical protein
LLVSLQAAQALINKRHLVTLPPARSRMQVLPRRRTVSSWRLP